MKTRNLLTLLFLTFCANQLFATDRIVQMSGPVGTYASIGAAITAAVDGDIIVINNRLDGLPWQENLTIAKSLTFVSAVDNLQWWMEGNITITLAEGRVVTVVGMRNTLTSATISRSGATPVNRTIVNIVGCDIAGALSMSTGVNLYLASCKVGSFVDFSFGKIIGNEIVRSLTCYSDVATEDVNLIIGNKISTATNTSGSGVHYQNNTQYLYFSNNFVRGSSSTAGLYIQTLKNGSTTNRIVNNTLTSSSTNSYANNYQALYIASAGGGQLVVENNILCGNFVSASNGSNGIYQGGGSSSTNFYFNMYYNPSTTNGTTLSTSLGNFSSGLAILANISSDGAILGSLHINTGNPSNAYLDLDLTRNDIGCYGGSYSLANFLPMMNNPESARMNYVNAPRIVPQGGTVNLQAIGYDK